MDCADKSISENAADELIATAINTVDLMEFAEADAGGLIAAINAVSLMYCVDILI